jgi:nuclear transport factor 2 (NTF2) superfamily protein
MRNCVLGSKPGEENNGRHKTPIAALFMGFRNRKGSACEGWLEQPQSRKVALAYSHDSRWRNRSECINGGEAIIAFSRGNAIAMADFLT